MLLLVYAASILVVSIFLFFRTKETVSYEAAELAPSHTNNSFDKELLAAFRAKAWEEWREILLSGASEELVTQWCDKYGDLFEYGANPNIPLPQYRSHKVGNTVMVAPTSES